MARIGQATVLHPASRAYRPSIYVTTGNDVLTATLSPHIRYLQTGARFFDTP
jgi:hypothetical protein